MAIVAGTAVRAAVEPRVVTRGGRVFDVDAVRRVPGGIASHRETIVVIGPRRPAPDADAPR